MMVVRLRWSRVAPAALALWLIASCSTIVPPRSPTDPVTAFLLDHGATSSLVLPTPEGNMTRYVYGDWNWYALGNTGVLDGLRAFFGPTQGTLGRRDLAGPPETQIVRQRIRAHAIEQLFALRVARADVERLRQRLDEEHRAGAQHARVHAHDLEFVPYPQRYSYGRNSNGMVASWLRELGCETHGLPLHSGWLVER